MEKCTVISDGDKIKTIREKYDLKQDEISGNDITRNLISEIETNKANITKKTAEVIIKNLTELAKKKGFKVTETVEYLMENQIEQANKILDDYIEELKALVISRDGSFIETLKKAEVFLIDWDIKDKKLRIYELAGDYFCNQNDFYKSSIYYEKANALINKRQFAKELLNILRKLSMVYFYTEKYKESIKCSEFATIYFSDIDNKNRAVFLYNSALCYEKLKNFNKALDSFDEVEQIIDKNDESKYVQILIGKATCLLLLKKYDEALKIFNKILELVNEKDIEKYLITLVNMSNVYIEINDNSKVNEILEIILKQVKNINVNFTYVSDIYILK
ncbi:tetratricopeptide repeat protein [Clostridium neuense]|uniref:Tetratricopeptide repeat protein n=1 Tax=Clostridium neuense TaxID=1728934 RepID=A0ABW8TER4_9CLOT